MSSILTNMSSMVALQTLKMVNKGLDGVQNQISTGLKVANAKDNASIWGVAQTMRSDVGGFKQLNDSLATGNAAVGVARTASETVTDLLSQMKEKIVAAQSPSADRGKLQADVAELRNQISSVVSGAQFYGLNLVDGTQASIDVLASLDREAAGNVTASNITVSGQNLATAAGAVRGGLTGSEGATTNADNAAFTLDAGETTAKNIVIDATNLAAGDRIDIGVGSKTASYTVTQADVDSASAADVIAVKLKAAVENLGVAGVVVDYDSLAAGTLSFTNDGTGNADRVVSASVTAVGSGGLAALAGIDVSSATGAGAALGAIEGLITTAIDASAALGSSQKRIETQSSFIGKLIDSVNSGIGALVDADLEEASARLQALQVQQQLGIQSLSIANQAPQNVLALFR